jgi:sulfite reductase (NADPH) flavoprotein alpha-component
MESQVLDAPASRSAGEIDTSANVTVLYGSQTGNAEMVAGRFAEAARESGLRAEVCSLNDFGVDGLARASLVVIVTSTYNEGGNEGDMPDNAELFWKALVAPAPRLDGLRYAVLALGDQGYFDFCRAGVLIDQRLEQLGAERFADRVDCDAIYEEAAEAWTKEVVATLAVEYTPDSSADVPATPDGAGQGWSRRNPFRARLLEKKTLTPEASPNEVRHYVLDLGGSGISYTAGDSISVQPVNDPALVDAVMARVTRGTGADIDQASLRGQFTHDLEIRTPSNELINALAERDPGSELAKVVRSRDRASLEAWLYGRDVLDLLQASPEVELAIEELPRLFRPLLARQFSIASSPATSPDRVDLTVSTVRYGHAREHGGVATTYLADRVAVGETVSVFPQPNAAFSLPDDPAASIIMIAAGTGIAPFRGFLQEREAQGAAGRNWLFFGARHRAGDFLYETELERWAEEGLLTRLDLAFSRDQVHKEYVQTRMVEHAAEVFAWLEAGCYIFVCGDAQRMAIGVQNALIRIIAEQAGLDASGAQAYLDSLVLAKRYLRDVY